jgi:hypothetical protein
LTALLFAGSAVVAHAAGPGDCAADETWNAQRGCVKSQTDVYGGQIPGGNTTTIPVVRARNGEPPRCYRDASGERRELPCVTDHGWWNGTCYVRQITEPPAGREADFERAMGDHDDGVVIGCYYTVCDSPEDVRNDVDADLLRCPVFNWAPDADPVDPALVAEEIWARLTKTAFDVGVAPYADPDHAGYVGIPTWYWVADPSDSTIGPLEDSDSSRGFTVVADSRVDHVEFDLDNGVVLECPPDSLPFERGKNYGRIYPNGSPDCGYTFSETGTYDIRARSVWIESWAGLGQAGTREFELGSQVATIRIGENQALRQ